MYESLHELGIRYGTDKATAHGYCQFYEEMLSGFEPKRILEIGVKDGASLRMWKSFFPEAMVYGIDINPPIQVDGCRVIQLDATDIYGIYDVFRETEFDLIIDDGNHFTRDQQIALFYLFEFHLKMPGFYIMEDVHTSFISAFKNSRFTTYEVIHKNFDSVSEFWGKGTRTDSGTIVIKKKK